jgi:hypothetical protein
MGNHARGITVILFAITEVLVISPDILERFPLSRALPKEVDNFERFPKVTNVGT